MYLIEFLKHNYVKWRLRNGQYLSLPKILSHTKNTVHMYTYTTISSSINVYT